MTLFASRAEFSIAHAGTTKWDRLLAAIDNAGSIEQGVAHSIGDSLTYWRGTPDALSDESFVGHRRYQTVFVGLAGDTQVELAPVSGLATTESYSDLTDREKFAPPAPAVATVLTVAPGQILAVPIDQAWRVRPRAEAQVLTVRITVEGATFHNK